MPPAAAIAAEDDLWLDSHVLGDAEKGEHPPEDDMIVSSGPLCYWRVLGANTARAMRESRGSGVERSRRDVRHPELVGTRCSEVALNEVRGRTRVAIPSRRPRSPSTRDPLDPGSAHVHTSAGGRTVHTARARPPSVQSTTEFAATDQQAEETTPWVGAAASEGGCKASVITPPPGLCGSSECERLSAATVA